MFSKPIEPLLNHDEEEEDRRHLFSTDYSKKFYTIPGQVNYVVESVETVNMNHADFPKIHLLSKKKNHIV